MPPLAHVVAEGMSSVPASKSLALVLVARLPAYTWFGESRKGSTEDEHMGVFYRKDRLRVRDSGNFWLSDTPDVPGSRTWGNILPRMVTWARFERIADGATLHGEASVLRRGRLASFVEARLSVDGKVVGVGSFSFHG